MTLGFISIRSNLGVIALGSSGWGSAGGVCLQSREHLRIEADEHRESSVETRGPSDDSGIVCAPVHPSIDEDDKSACFGHGFDTSGASSKEYEDDNGHEPLPYV